MTSGSSSIAAVILAAGESRRMGSPKALLQFRGETFLDGLIAKLDAYCNPVIAVLGCNAELIRQTVVRPVRWVHNPDFAMGMLTSLQRGLREVDARAAYAIFTLVDHPNPASETLRSLIAAPDAPVAIPRFEGRKGHPVRISRGVIDEIISLPVTATARDVLNRYLAHTLFLDVDDPGVVDDIDDPAAYRRLLAHTASLGVR